jgi:nicotinate dehydrogenase subunit A
MLQAAFITEQAAQCGYCINGILMSVTALLHKNASPSRADLNESLNRHLCRCGTHIRILRAIDRVIAQLKEGVSL